MEEILPGSLYITLIILIILSGFFSSSETGLMAMNKYRLRHLANQGHGGARIAQKLLRKPDRLIGLILLGNNLVNILAASIATVIGIRLFGSNVIERLNRAELKTLVREGGLIPDDHQRMLINILDLEQATVRPNQTLD